LKIDLANIAGIPGARGRFTISEQLSADEGVACVGPVAGELTVENAGSLLLVRGRLQARLRLACVRCLAEGEQELEIEVEEEFASEGASPEVRTIDREEPEASAITDFVLDAHEFARQQVVANAPMSFLCRPDCPGICPQCGKDLNGGPCGCALDRGEGGLPGQGWAKLAELLEKTAGEDR